MFHSRQENMKLERLQKQLPTGAMQSSQKLKKKMP